MRTLNVKDVSVGTAFKRTESGHWLKMTAGIQPNGCRVAVNHFGQIVFCHPDEPAYVQTMLERLFPAP